MKALLKTARAHRLNGQAVIRAASRDDVSTVRLQLEWPEHAPRPDCQDGRTLVLAAEEGHLGLVDLLLRTRVASASAIAPLPFHALSCPFMQCAPWGGVPCLIILLHLQVVRMYA